MYIVPFHPVNTSSYLNSLLQISIPLFEKKNAGVNIFPKATGELIFFVVHDRIDTITINCNPNIQNLLPVNSIYYIVFGYSNNTHILIQQIAMY